jgi:hypothetical protein
MPCLKIYFAIKSMNTINNIGFILQSDVHITINFTVLNAIIVFVDLDPLSELYMIIPFVRHREH